MPVVLRDGGFRFRFYAKDHAPPHVHALKGGASVIIGIGTGVVRNNKGMKIPDVLRAVKIVEQHQERLLASWIEFDQKRRNPNGLASH